MADNIVHVTDETFEEIVLKSDKPVLLDFSAEWCPPCKMLAPIIEEIAGEYLDTMTVAGADTDTCPETAAKYKVTAVPTLIFFKDGEEVERLTGFRNKEDLKSTIDAVV